MEEQESGSKNEAKQEGIKLDNQKIKNKLQAIKDGSSGAKQEPKSDRLINLGEIQGSQELNNRDRGQVAQKDDLLLTQSDMSYNID